MIATNSTERDILDAAFKLRNTLIGYARRNRHYAKQARYAATRERIAARADAYETAARLLTREVICDE